MSEKITFDFSKPEDHEKFNQLQPDEKQLIVDNAHDEALEHQNQVAINKKINLLPESAKALPTELQEIILSVDWFKNIDQNNQKIKELVLEKVRVEVDFISKLFGLAKSNDVFAKSSNLNCPACWSGTTNFDTDADSKEFVSKLEDEGIQKVFIELKEIRLFIDIFKKDPAFIENFLRERVGEFLSGNDSFLGTLKRPRDRFDPDSLYFNVVEDPLFSLFRKIIESKSDICYIAPTSAVFGAIVAKKAVDEFRKIDNNSADTYFAYPSMKPQKSDVGDIEILYNEYYKKKIDVVDDEDTREKLKVPKWQDFNEVRDHVQIFGKIIDEFKQVILRKMKEGKSHLKIMVFDESYNEGRTMRTYKEIVRLAWKSCLTEGLIPTESKLDIIEGPYIKGSTSPLWPKVLITQDRKISRISRKQNPYSSKIANLSLDVANILGDYIAHKWKVFKDLNELREK